VLALERGKNEEWARDALRAAIADESARVLALHAARAAIAEFFDAHARPEQLEALLAEPPEEIERVSAELQASLDLAVAEAIAGAGEADPRGAEAAIEPILDAMAAARRATHITEDLGDESFTIRVRLPGEVLATDADEVVDGVAVWRFHGKELRDREQRLELRTVLRR
jgi:hypothetical protein